MDYVASWVHLTAMAVHHRNPRSAVWNNMFAAAHLKISAVSHLAATFFCIIVTSCRLYVNVRQLSYVLWRCMMGVFMIHRLYTLFFFYAESSTAHLYVVGMLRFVSFDINQQSLSTPFYSALGVYFCLYGPFNCVSFHKFSRQFSAFSSFSSGLISTLFVLSTIYLFLKVCLMVSDIPAQGNCGRRK